MCNQAVRLAEQIWSEWAKTLRYTYIVYLINAAYMPSDSVYFSYYILTHLVDYTASHTVYTMYVRKIWIYV
jgi:hypothetical protein